MQSQFHGILLLSETKDILWEISEIVYKRIFMQALLFNNLAPHQVSVV